MLLLFVVSVHNNFFYYQFLLSVSVILSIFFRYSHVLFSPVMFELDLDISLMVSPVKPENDKKEKYGDDNRERKLVMPDGWSFSKYSL